MLTRQGLVAVVAGIVAIVVGRLFAILELFIIGSALVVAVVFGLLYVALRTPVLSASRWAHPSMLSAGDAGTVDIDLVHGGSLRSPRFLVEETIRRPGDAPQVAPLGVEPLRARAQVRTGYELPTTRRGRIELGPLVAVVSDPLGVARRTRTVSGVDSVVVAPRAYQLPMPVLGSGPLGQQLLAQARRLGFGEFHSLREYVDGDEPRSIHWRASARSDDLLVKQHTLEGLRRALVVLDPDPNSYATAAASLVTSAAHHELATRFVTGHGIDLRGPDVAITALDVLASVEPAAGPLPTLDRDPGEGIGLAILITGAPGSTGSAAVGAIVDPTITVVPVTTDVAPRSKLGAAARTDEEFVRSWRALAGTHRSRAHQAARPA